MLGKVTLGSGWQIRLKYTYCPSQLPWQMLLIDNSTCSCPDRAPEVFSLQCTRQQLFFGQSFIMRQNQLALRVEAVGRWEEVERGEGQLCPDGLRAQLMSSWGNGWGGAEPKRSKGDGLLNRIGYNPVYKACVWNWHGLFCINRMLS